MGCSVAIGKRWLNEFTRPCENEVRLVELASPEVRTPKLRSVMSFRRKLAPTLTVCDPHVLVKSSMPSYCVTLRPCGNAKFSPPRVVNAFEVSVVGNALATALGFASVKTAL